MLSCNECVCSSTTMLYGCCIMRVGKKGIPRMGGVVTEGGAYSIRGDAVCHHPYTLITYNIGGTIYILFYAHKHI